MFLYLPIESSFIKWFTIIFFSFVDLILIVLLPGMYKISFSKDPLIEITEDYIYDGTSLVALGKIYFKDIKDLRMKYLFLCIDLDNEEDYYSSFNFYQKSITKINKKMGNGSTSINISILGKKAPFVLEYINEKYSQEIIRRSRYN